MPKYPIDKAFFPFSRFTPPISERFLSLAVPHMKVPKALYRDPSLTVSRHAIPCHDGKEIDCLLLSPASAAAPLPCLIYLHGGGFVLPAAAYHYKNAMHYAKTLQCKVWFVQYRLAPQHPHPIFFEDCCSATHWLYAHADTLGIDVRRIGIGGDSAGATLAVGTCMMLRDRCFAHMPVFQLLAYPFLDARSNSAACQKYTDTPMWNAKLSQRIQPMTKVDRSRPDYCYYSPVEADNLNGLPPAYIETAQYDCLHDDGILYAQKLREAGIEVVLNETEGTMHGFDIVQHAKITQDAIASRVAFMKKYFSSLIES